MTTTHTHNTTPAADASGAPRPRVLYVGAGSPWAGGAGHLQRQMMWLRALDRIADVTAVLFGKPSDEPCPFDMTVVPVKNPPKSRRSRLRLWWDDRFNPRPRLALDYDTTDTRACVAELQPESFDAVFAYRVDFAHFAGVLGHPRLLLDIDDPEHIRVQRRIELDTGEYVDDRTRRDVAKLQRYELAAASNAHEVYLCQSGDAAAFPPDNVFIAPNTVDTPDTCPTRQPAAPTLGFVGNFSQSAAAPNVDGLRWLIDHVWPRVLASQPAARLVLIGPIGRAAEAILADATNIERIGFVKEVPEALSAMTLSLAPIRFGTGTRIKILDAFAGGCPVVSTAMGCDGLGAKDNEHLFIADDPHAFADRCVELLNDTELRARIGKAGWQHAREHFNRDRWVAQLADRLKTHIAAINGS